MKKLFILITLLSIVFAFADQNTKSKPIKKDKPKECKQKKYCKEMTSCKEAKFYLEVCGHSNLDRDKDDIPCENVCK